MFLINFYGLIWFYSPFVMRLDFDHRFQAPLFKKKTAKNQCDWVSCVLLHFYRFMETIVLKLCTFRSLIIKTNLEIEFSDVFLIVGYRLCVLISKFQVLKKSFSISTFVTKSKRRCVQREIFPLVSVFAPMMMNVTLIF